MSPVQRVENAVVCEPRVAAAPTARLTSRDRQLLAVMVSARYLSTGQVARLVFFGRDESAARRRLAILSGARGRAMRAPYVIRSTYRGYRGELVCVWAPADRAYLVAHDVLGETRLPPTTPEVGAEYLDHVIATNDLLVGALQPEPGAVATAAGLGFRWIPTDTLRLTFEHFDLKEGRPRARVIAPDAAVEFPHARERWFVEYESGAQLLSDPENEGSTISKLHRYERYLYGLADVPKGLTWYRKEYSDGLSPELLFVTATPARRDAINAVIASWRSSSSGRSKARALGMEEAVGELRRLAGSPPQAGRASRLGGEGLAERDLQALRAFGEQALTTIKHVRHAVRRGDRISKEPAYPAAYGAFDALLKRLGGKR